VEFGARRAHGLEAGVLAARAAFLSGCASTSNVEAGRRFGIPVSGTMAHSWVMAMSNELSAFQQYAAVFGDKAVLLLDTYDPIEATRSIVAAGLRPRSVRLDSGDLTGLSRDVRDILDEGGLADTGIFTSGDLDEWRIHDIVSAGAPVDGFGVGAALSTVSDVPSLGAIYKLVEIDRGGVTTPVMKRSVGKPTLPGRKQVWRVFEDNGASEDVIEHVGEGLDVPSAVPLLRRVMSDGKRDTEPLALSELRSLSKAALAAIPEGVRRIHHPQPYRVRFGRALQAAVERFGTHDC
jgi:nicotinate phosphoribosyltransferase